MCVHALLLLQAANPAAARPAKDNSISEHRNASMKDCEDVL